MTTHQESLRELLGIELPVIQAPMAAVQGSALAVAVSNAGGLGSLPCAMLTVDVMRKELATICAQTSRPFNVNFFYHAQPSADIEREAVWKMTLARYYEEFGMDVNSIEDGPVRMAFNSEAADALEEFKPAVVSFHFGLPPQNCLRECDAEGPRFSRQKQPLRRRFGLKRMGPISSSRKASRRAGTGESSYRMT